MKQVIKTQAAELANLINQGMSCWVKAGEILVGMLDNENMTIEQVGDITDIQSSILTRFEQLGRKQLVPKLLVASYPAARSLQKLPYSEQTRLIDSSVEVLTSDGDKLNISIKNLTPSQCRQVFGQSSVRDVAGQRAWVESRKVKKSHNEVVEEMPYHIERNSVYFSKGCSMKAGQLVNILAQLTSKK